MLIEGIDLRKSYRVGWLKKRVVRVLSRVSLAVSEGETVGIIGGSGSGKTTLGLILTGLIKPEGGRVLFRGRELDGMNVRERKSYRRKVQIIFQHPETAFNPKWKLLRSLSEPYRLYKIPFAEESVLKQIEAVGLGAEHLARYPAQLSGGELQRAAIARVMALDPEFIVLDEPTGMLDAITQAQIIRLFQDLQKDKGVAYLFISHDLELARLFCRRIYRLREGELETLGPEKGV
ncbi:MAG: dipeptide/oligopeptide/nickel ABC transporter ATP-binding protein [Peptococcaceae bacterium]|nr:dipeptide/oligopeptide/nickel ABC transporter ATP-binding protein [Peptococcaceae bacterium]